jgi:hypothetical protein
MTDYFQEIDGVGPAREEHLEEAGYDSYEDLAKTKPSMLEEEIPRLSEDSALSIIVQAQNMTESEIEGEESNTETKEEQEIPESTNNKSNSSSNEEIETYPVMIKITDGSEYDALYDALLQHRQKLIGTNREGIDRTSEYIDALRDIRTTGTIELELTGSELNNLQNAILQQRLDYQGRNLSEKMESLRRIENRVNNLREKYLF